MSRFGTQQAKNALEPSHDRTTEAPTERFSFTMSLGAFVLISTISILILPVLTYSWNSPDDQTLYIPSPYLLAYRRAQFDKPEYGDYAGGQ